MKRWLKVLILLVFAGFITGFLVYRYIYNKPHPDYEKAKPHHSLSARSLYEAFLNDEKGASEKFNGKVIEIDGMLSKVETNDNLVIAVFEFSEGIFGAEGVRVTMLPAYHETILNYETGQQVNLKGLCTGFNGSDVIMEKGSVVK